MRVTVATLRSARHRLAAPLTTARGTITERQSVFLTLHDDAGHVATGEASPLPGFSNETLATCRAALDALVTPSSRLFAARIDDASAIVDLLLALRLPASASHALDHALLGLLAQRRGTSVARLLGAERDAHVHSHRLVSSHAAARAACVDGACTLKIKVGAAALDEDIARVAAIRAAVGRDVALRLDANRAWPDDVAHAALARLATLDVALVEEPLADPTPARLAALRVHEVPLAADESCRDRADLEALAAARAVDVVVLKPMLLGGPSFTVQLARRAAELGLGVVVTTCLDAEPARRAAHAAALACPAGARMVAGLDPAASVQMTAVRARLPDPIAAAACARPDHPAIVTPDGRAVSWRALADRSARVAAALTLGGVVPGDVVALELAPTSDAVARLWGALRLGATVLPLRPGRPGPERERILAAAAPRLFLAHDAPCDADAADPVVRDWDLDQTCLLVASSGTTSRTDDTPRLHALSLSQLVFSALGSALRLGHLPTDRWLLALPLDHVGGLSVLVRSALAATTVVLLPRFDPQVTARALDEGAASIVSLVPEMLTRVLDARPPTPFPPSLRAILLGGAAAPEPLLDRCRALGAPVARTWGMTECGSQIATTFAGPVAEQDDWLPPLLGAQVALTPDGRLVVRGTTAPGGAFVTSDRGQVDDRGRVRVSGRADDVIISGGENIDPTEVEAVLRSHPAIADVLVVGRPDPRWGARPVAALVAAEPLERPSDDALRRWVNDRLASLKCPDAFHWLDALPRNELGKVSRARILERLQR